MDPPLILPTCQLVLYHLKSRALRIEALLMFVSVLNTPLSFDFTVISFDSAPIDKVGVAEFMVAAEFALPALVAYLQLPLEVI